MPYRSARHAVFHHRYHIVRIIKYRSKVLKGQLRERIGDIIRQVCHETGVTIVRGVLSTDHIHMLVGIPPKLSVSQFVQNVKEKSSYKVQSRVL